MKRKCGIDGCNSNHSAKGLCNLHYLIILRGGGFRDVKQFSKYGAPPHEKMLDGFIIDENSSCWEWKKTKVRGRGQIKYRGKNFFAYRVSYEHFIGEIPEGLTIDHLCENRACVNPFHLEPVTLSENTKRYHCNRTTYGAERPKRLTCKNGHRWEGDNIVVHAGRTVCRICNNESSRRHNRRKQLQ